jgi:phosphoribosylaminoimidazole carboxylase (NCAIR synthetase)
MLHRRSPRRKGKDDGERFGEGKKVEVDTYATKRAVLGRNFSPRNIFIATVMLLTLITTHYLRAPDAATAVATDKVAVQSSPHNVTSTRKYTPPSFLQEAIDHCKAAKKEHGEYPSMSEQIVDKRILRWRNNRRKDNFLQMINDKLGGYMFASKHGVRTPRVLFCGKAKDISKSMDSFGNKYVIKPLKGHSAQGVKVVRDGLDIMANETVSHDTLINGGISWK